MEGQVTEEMGNHPTESESHMCTYKLDRDRQIDRQINKQIQIDRNRQMIDRQIASRQVGLGEEVSPLAFHLDQLTDSPAPPPRPSSYSSPSSSFFLKYRLFLKFKKKTRIKVHLTFTRIKQHKLHSRQLINTF